MSLEPPCRFELFVRSLEPATAAPTHVEAVETLVDLAADDGVSFDVHVWGDHLPLDSACARTRTAAGLHDRVRELRAWAAERDADLPGFERVRTDTLVGSAREALTLPSLLLAVYRSGKLVAVAPRVERSTLHGIPETLAEIADAPDVGRDTSPTARP